MKAMPGIFLLMCMPLAAATSDKAYPSEKVAEFIVEKLDVTSMPSAIQPKREKGKKTFGDYGYVTRKLDDNEALIEPPRGGSQITISVLEQNKSGIYVCLNGQAEKQDGGRIQRVFLLKKNGSGLLKGRESSKEFQGCPVIGGGESDSVSDGY